MSYVASTDPSSHGTVDLVAIPDLTAGESIRLRGVDPRHVEVLIGVPDEWPPITIWGSENRVIDGHHRVAAAKRLGMQHIRAERLHGTGEQMYLEAVRRNVGHGLPLTLDERTEAAKRLLRTQRDWSDRRIAAACGISATRVAGLRRAVPAPRSAGSSGQRRTGLDGKSRPDRPDNQRELILTVLKERPELSLRAVGHLVGASPETVRRVKRTQLTAHLDPDLVSTPSLVDGDLSPSERHAADPFTLVGAGSSRPWIEDPALQAERETRQFARWFDSHAVEERWLNELPTLIPINRIYEIADEARRRSQFWATVVTRMESRVNRQRAG